MAETATDATESPSVQERAYQLMNGLWSGQVIYTAESVGILDNLADGPKTPDQIAHDCSSHEDNTSRLLRALSHHGVVEKTHGDEFRLTPTGECFLTDHPQSIRTDLRFARSPEYVRAMLHLPTIVKDGDPNGFVREFDRGLYEYAQNWSDFRSVLNEFMSGRLRRRMDEILLTLKSVGIQDEAHICDVGGGHGSLLAQLLDTDEGLRGTVYDLPEVIAEQDKHAAEDLGVKHRCAYVPGDMFESVPKADIYLLKEILHNWGEQECIEILSTVHESAPPDARLFIIEGIVPESDIAHPTKQLDIVMMALLGGKERTESEYTSLLQRAGWNHAGTHATPSEGVTVLTAERT